MCGISGVFGIEDRDLTRKMIQELKVRGPENIDFAVTEIGSIANARLSIIDVEGGNQPIWNNDGTVCIVANCEIYNFRELRKDLEHKYEFKTKSDTEVILHAYQEYGLDFAKVIDGIFAVAILDLNSKQLVLARDRLGIKPLYYWKNGETFLFGSEIKAILQYEQVNRILDLNNLHVFIQLGYVFRNHTLFKDIHQMNPGTVMVISSDGIQTKTYWEPENFKSQTLDIDYLYDLLENAVEAQLVSERPLGVYLSGGLDSSIVAAIAAKKLDRVEVFTQDFGEVNEASYAAEVANLIGADHYIQEFSPEDEISSYKDALYAMEHPTYSLTATYHLAKFARSKGNVVMLSGLGGDELFGGYVAHARALKIQKTPQLKPLSILGKSTFEAIGSYKLARMSLALGDKVSKILSIKTSESERDTSRLFGTPMPPLEWEQILKFQKEGPFFNIMESELIYSQLEGNYLRIADRMSMGASLELRVPLLHTPLVEYSLGLPIEAKINNGISKFALRKIAREKLNLPAKVVKRGEKASNKGGYGFSPLDFWNRGFKDYIQSNLDPQIINERRIFNEKGIEKYMKRKKTFANIRILWNLAATHEMMEVFNIEEGHP